MTQLSQDKAISFANAKEIMLQEINPITESMTLSINQVLERISYDNIYSPNDFPVFDNSAVDGYAVRINDVHKLLPIIGISLAGKPFIGPLPGGTTIQVMTGAIIPCGCEAVVMQEDVCYFSNAIKFSSITEKKNIRYQGESIKKNQQIIAAGSKFSIAEISLMASLGLSKIKVFRKLRVALCSIGEELKEIGTSLQMGQVYDVNRMMIKLMLLKLNCEVIDLGILGDDRNELHKSLLKADQQVDIIVTTGGASVGQADYIKSVIKELGKIYFSKIAIKPGKPFIFGCLANSWFCGLPGNPISAAVTFYQLVQPLLVKLSGQKKNVLPIRHRAILLDPLKKKKCLLEFKLGFCNLNGNGILQVKVIKNQGSHILNALMLANCFILLDYECQQVNYGELVNIEFFNNLIKS